MSLIKRVEISNFIHLYGPEASDAEWNPRYRHNLYDLRAQSTAMSIPNGVGKSSFAEAIISVLSRDTALARATRIRMSPPSCGTYSHVRIELLIPEQRATSDMLVTSGYSVPGETWVFGVCGHKGKPDECSYYYYQGTLEDCPIARVADGNRIELIPNDAFNKTKRTISKLRYDVTARDWREIISKHHFPSHTIKQMAEFQKKGAGDTAANIFNITERTGREKYHETFFYSIIAPELLSGAMGDESEEEEYFLEDTLVNSGRTYLKAKRETQKKADSLEKSKANLDALTDVSRKATELLELSKGVKRLFGKISGEASIIKSIIEMRFVGIPFVDSYPLGKLGDVAKGLIIVHQFGVVIQDSILAKITGETTSEFNRINRSVTGCKITQPIEIIAHNYVGKQHKPGPKGKGYSQEQVQTLLKDYPDSLGLVNRAFQWFELDVESNPYRLAVLAYAREVSMLHDKSKKLATEQIETSEKITVMELNIKKIDSYRDAWNTLNDSGVFSAEELKAPLETAQSVGKEYESISNSINSHDDKVKQLTKLSQAYEKMKEEFGEGVLPADILSQNHDAIIDCKQKRKETKIQHKQDSNMLRNLDRDKVETERATATIELQLVTLKEQSQKCDEFQVLFGDTPTDGLESLVINERDNLKSRLGELPKLISGASESVQSLHAFKQRNPTQEPTAWLEDATKRYDVLAGKLNTAISSKEELLRQLNDLENESVAASTISNKALALIEDNNLPFERLYTVVQSARLDEDKLRQMLSHFSALLFAPVAQGEEDAVLIAKLLHEHNIPVPVYLQSELTSFINDGVLQSNPSGLVFNHQAGVCTRVVDCLIDPQLTETEKVSVSEKITSLEEVITTIRIGMKELHGDSELVTLAKQARQAISDDCESLLERLMQESSDLGDKEEMVNNRASHHSITLIRSMIEFNAAGGTNEITRVTSALNHENEQFEGLVERIENINLSLTNLNERVEKLEAQIDKLTLTNTTVIALNKASEFISRGGDEFLKGAKTKSSALGAELMIAKQRNQGDYLFQQAAAFLESKDDDMQEQLHKIKRQKLTVKNLLKEISDIANEVARLTIKKNRASGLEVTLDGLVSLMLEKHRDLRACRDMLLDEERSDTPEAVIMSTQFMCERGLNEVDDSDRVDALTSIFNKMEIRSNARDASREQEKEHKGTDALATLANVTASLNGLNVNVSMAVREAARNPNELIALREKVLVEYNREVEVFATGSKVESKLRNEATKRMVDYCDEAQDNFRKMKNVFKGADATLVITATIADKDTLVDLVESVMTFIEDEENHYEKTKESTKGEDLRHKKSLKEKVRERIYRGIFSKPDVKVIHPNIHNGRAFSINKTVASGGQYTAVALMIMAKLAEYTMQRESDNRHDPSSIRRRAVSSSSSVLIIDGLFSNLSDRAMIRNSLESLRASRGNFQLIGLIHSPAYENNSEIFPTYIIGKGLADPSDPQGPTGIVYLKDGNKIASPNDMGREAGEMDCFAIHVTH